MKLVCVRLLRTALLLPILFAGFTVDAADQFVYSNSDIQGANKILGFRVAADSSLSEILGSPFPTGGSGGGGLSYFASNRIVISAPSRFLFASNSGSNDVSAFSIDPTSGNLTPVAGSPFPLDSFPSWLGRDLLGGHPERAILDGRKSIGRKNYILQHRCRRLAYRRT